MMSRLNRHALKDLLFAGIMILAVTTGASAQGKDADAIVDAAMAPCFKNVATTVVQQIRAMLLIKARAIAADRPLTQAEQTRAEGMMVSIEDPNAYDDLSCITQGDSPLADWTAELKWAGVITPDAIDPAAEAKRIAKICTWGVGASVRERYAGLVARWLRWKLVEKLEKRELDATERRQRDVDDKAARVIPDKTGRQIVECVIETTKGTPVELRIAEPAQQKKKK